MTIKENVNKDVLDFVSTKMNVTNDLLIEMISSDLHIKAIMCFTIVLATLILLVFLGIMAYFRLRKNWDDFFGTGFVIICMLLIAGNIFSFLLTNAYKDYFEIIYNHDYAVVKEINKIYEELNK